MAFTALRDMKPFSQLMFSIFIMVACVLFLSIIALIIAIPIWGLDMVMNLPAIEENTSKSAINFLKYLQVTQAFGLFIIPSIIVGKLFKGSYSDYLHLNKKFGTQSVILILVMMFLSGPLVNLIGELNASMVFPDFLSGVEDWMRNKEDQLTEVTMAFLAVDGVSGLLFNLFMIALLPAIGEELLFRGVFQNIFTRMTRNSHWAIWITAFIFSAFHFQFYGFVPRLLLGAVFGYLLVWSGSMWLPIIAHFINNAISVIGIYMVDKGILDSKVEELGSTTDSYYMAAISLGLVVLMLAMIKKQNSGNELLVKSEFS